MSILLLLKDESATGEHLNLVRLKVSESELTVRELLQRRVQQEVGKFNRERPVCYQALVYPQGAQETSRGFRLGQHRDLDWQIQLQRALRSFELGALTVYVDAKAVTELDAVLPLRDAMEIVFVKLSPIVAG